METARDITEVIDKIIAIVPKTQKKLIERLKWVKEDAFYKAPEQQCECWVKLASGLGEYIPLPLKKDWQKKILKIMKDN